MQALLAKQGFSIKITEDSQIWDEVFEKLYYGRVSAYPDKEYIEEEKEYIAVYIAN